MTDANASSVCMVGAFPPPVHGMATVNEAMRANVAARGSTPIKLDVAADSLSRARLQRLKRTRHVAVGLGRYWLEVLRGRGGTLYAGLSGGWGQLYEALFVASARLRGARIYLHHHSFAYLDRRHPATALLVQLAGPDACHIVLCDCMARKLCAQYSQVGRTVALSNALFVEPVTASRVRTRLGTVGFLGNLSREKGIAELIEVAEGLASRGDSLGVQVAGPCENKEIEQLVRAAARRIPRFEYVGPRYGDDKRAFWESIDVLLFPSKYVNEAAPLVVYEALARGIPVIAWERGCLSSMVPEALLVARDQQFALSALAKLDRWRTHEREYAEACRNASARFSEQLAGAAEAVAELIAEMSSS